MELRIKILGRAYGNMTLVYFSRYKGGEIFAPGSTVVGGLLEKRPPASSGAPRSGPPQPP